jgi:hypothetical protein
VENLLLDDVIFFGEKVACLVDNKEEKKSPTPLKGLEKPLKALPDFREDNDNVTADSSKLSYEIDPRLYI